MSKIKKRQDAVPAIRNFVAKHQYQRGGVHEKPYKSKRQKAKQQLKKAIRSQSAADFFLSPYYIPSLYSRAKNNSLQGASMKAVLQYGETMQRCSNLFLV